MTVARHADLPAELTPIAFEVLLSLAGGPLHGYGIKPAIEERTEGELVLGSGTLSQAIQRFEREGLIAADGDGRRRGDARRGATHRLEQAGRAALMRHLHRLRRAVDYALMLKLLAVREVLMPFAERVFVCLTRAYPRHRPD